MQTRYFMEIVIFFVLVCAFQLSLLRFNNQWNLMISSFALIDETTL